MKVHLTKKEADKWAGVKFYKNCAHGLESYLTRSGRRYTGLEKEDAERLGKELGYDLKPESSFWNTFRIKLGNERDIIILDTEDPWGELQYKFAKSHKRVATTLRDITPGKDFLLTQNTIEATESNKIARVKRKAIAAFDTLTPDQMRKALRLFGINATNSNNEIVEDQLFKIVEQEPQKFLDVWVNNEAKDTQFLIEEAVAKNIIRRTKSTYKYGTDVLGYTLNETIDYLDNPANRDLRISILSQLEGKTTFNKEILPKIETISEEIKEATKPKKTKSDK